MLMMGKLHMWEQAVSGKSLYHLLNLTVNFSFSKILIKLHICTYNFGIITNLLKSSKYSTKNIFYEPFKIQKVWCSKLPSLHLHWQEYLLRNHSATIKNRRLIPYLNLPLLFKLHCPNNILYAEKNHILL